MKRYPRPLRPAAYVVLPTCKGWGFPWGDSASDARVRLVCLDCNQYEEECQCATGARLTPLSPVEAHCDRIAA